MIGTWMRGEKRVILLLAALLALTGACAVREGARAHALENQVFAEYERAYYDTAERVGDMAMRLEKALITGSTAQRTALLGAISRQADSAQASLSALPAALPVASGAMKFVNQLGDFCRALGEKLMTGEQATPEEEKTMGQLLDAVTQLRDQMEEGARELASGRPAQALAEMTRPVSLNDTQPAEALISYPVLLYDGPFSDGRDEGTLIALGPEVCGREEAAETARAFVGEDRVRSVLVTGEAEVPVPAWEITCLTGDGILVLALSKQGGDVLYMLDESPVGGARYSPADAIDMARAFLSQQGYGEMEVSYWISAGSRVTVNFAAVQDGVILYPDLVKVEMSLGSGRVIGLEALNYLGSHRERTNLAPSLTEKEARGRLGRSLTCLRTRLCVIPLDAGETLCYECLAYLGEREYLVYIDAETGEERQIYKVIEDESGSLAI